MAGPRTSGPRRRFLLALGAGLALAGGASLRALDIQAGDLPREKPPAGGGAGVAGIPCETCPGTPIGCGVTLTGRLSAGDCARPAGQLLDIHSFDLADPGPVTIELRSAPLDPVLFLLDGDCTEVASNDDCRPNDLDLSCLTVDLPAGSYHIGVSSLEPGETGEYEVEIACPDARPCRGCEVGTAPCGGSVTGVLEVADCSLGGFPADVWRLDLAGPTALDISLTSGADLGLELLDPSCHVVASSDECPGKDLASCLALRQLAPGNYHIRVKGSQPGDEGTYDLRVDCAPFDPCRGCIEGRVACGGKVTGALEEGDCVLPEDGTPYDVWSLRLDEPLRATIGLESPAFDTALFLLGADCREIASTDECAGSDSCLVLDLPAGDYTLVASSLDSGATGPYSLGVECARNPLCVECRAGTIPCSGFVSGTLPATGCRHPDGSFIDVYDLSLSADSQVEIQLRASFDTYLLLVDSDCNVLATNDDCTEGELGRSCISIGLEAGAYAIWVNSLQAGETGDYTLEVGSADCAPCRACRVGAAACDGTVEGTFPASGCRLPGKLHLDLLELTLAERGGVTIAVESDAFDPSLTLHDASCAVIAANDDCDANTLDACLTLALEPGTYWVGINSFLPGESGAYRLSIACGRGIQPGDCNADGTFDISDGICVLEFLFSGVPGALPCGDSSLTDPANVSLLDFNGNGGIDISDAVAMFLFLFANGPPHPLGRECVPIAGCENEC